jgi:hypothetical protein
MVVVGNLSKAAARMHSRRGGEVECGEDEVVDVDAAASACLLDLFPLLDGISALMRIIPAGIGPGKGIGR